ncbi:hypothetical protein NKH77_37780 [Streptomyces sp. M19]
MVTDPNQPPPRPRGRLRRRNRPVPGDDTYVPPSPDRERRCGSWWHWRSSPGSWAGIALYRELFVSALTASVKGPHDECVGVSGGYEFDSTLEKVTDKIRDQNRAVEKSGKPWVSVVYFEPMTLGPNDKSKQSVQQEIEGAYLAQAELNSQATGGHGSVPQIKLLLANSGGARSSGSRSSSRSSRWRAGRATAGSSPWRAWARAWARRRRP